MKHTKGPWRTEEGMDDDTWTDVKHNADTIAMCHGYDYRTRTANARLIASAPDLLEALKSAMKWMDDRRELAEYVPEIATALNAIAKAEGKG